jgi:hypothetical protein
LGEPPVRLAHVAAKAEQVLGPPPRVDPYTVSAPLILAAGVRAPADAEADRMQIPAMKTAVVRATLAMRMS